MVQAWENWDIVKQFRVDPPLPAVVSSGVDREDLTSNVMENDDGGLGKDAGKEFITKEPVIIVPTKIHLFSIDWAPFKQIRTEDILSYFLDYGPSYVEWLGEISCNVLFEDKYSAARAFYAMSQELPSPPSTSSKMLNPTSSSSGGEEVATADASEEGGGAFMIGTDQDAIIIGNKERNEMDVVNVTAAEDTPNVNAGGNKKEDPMPDYGSMGWRFCKWTVRKVRASWCELSYY